LSGDGELLSRRAFLWRAAIASAVLTGAGVVGADVVFNHRGSRASTPPPSAPVTSAPPPATGDIRSDALWAAALPVGRAYLAQAPHEADRSRLHELVPDLAGPTRKDFAELAAPVEHDYENGHIVVVEGWVLSRTEARGAALVAIDR
jgi:hypothetical protein